MTMRTESGETFLVVRVPVANLRSKPVEPRTNYDRDEFQETQLLYNETLLYKGEEAGWYYVEAIEQARFSAEHGWHGYPGWVKKSDVSYVAKPPLWNSTVTVKTAPLYKRPREGASYGPFLSFGTRVHVQETVGEYACISTAEGAFAWVHRTSVSMREEIPNDPSLLRQHIVNGARLFVGTPYLWGGRSMFMADLTHTVTGVDCSGLTNLAHWASGLDLPRNAHDQWLAAEKISPDSLQPADLMFISKADQQSTIDHVALYVGQERIIEAFKSGTPVREITLKDKLGLGLTSLEKKNFVVEDKRVYFGCAKRLVRRE